MTKLENDMQLNEAVAGSFAGFTGTLVGFPLDTIKVAYRFFYVFNYEIITCCLGPNLDVLDLIFFAGQDADSDPLRTVVFYYRSVKIYTQE